MRAKGHNIVCSAEGCERKATTKLFCTMHYKRVQRNGSTDRVLIEYLPTAVCAHCGASGPLRNFLCNACRIRLMRKGFVERSNAPAGSGSVNAGGYVVHTVEGQRLYEHRVMAEFYHGRELLPGEVVHHIDGNRQNNTKNNLQILPSQSAHMQQHRSGAK